MTPRWILIVIAVVVVGVAVPALASRAQDDGGGAGEHARARPVTAARVAGLENRLAALTKRVTTLQRRVAVAGVTGPAGPPGAQGLPGPPGEAGFSEARTVFVNGPVAIPQDLFVEVASMTLPAGSYAAWASFSVIAPTPAASPDRITCQLSLSSQGGGIATTSEAFVGPPPDRAPFGITVAATRAGDVTARLSCSRSGTGAANANGIRLVVVRVGTTVP